jgi:asparagine synthase (glutamine-hydrolysing)
MCGIALLLGASLDGSDHRRFDVMVRGIEQRGESLEEERSDHALVATSRLKIVDRQHAIQPWRTGSGRHALCYNGEVFNFGSLRDRLVAEGVVLRSWSDTEVVAEAIAAWGTDALLQFRGEFAIALVDHDDGSVFLARDPAGVKPLYWARTGGRLHVASEVKALTGLGVPVTEVPPGHCGTGFADRDPELHPYIDLLELGTGEPMLDTVEEATSAVRATFIESVRRRVDTDLPVGIILSGGLDSSLVATQVAKIHPDCVAFTVGTSGSEDLEFARRLTTDLGMRHEVVEISPRRIDAARVKEAVRISEATEYGDVINAVVSMEVFATVHRAGVKVVLTGDGSDELFGGYAMYRAIDGDTTRRLFLHKIAQLSRTELQRVDRTSMGQCVEARVPFLDLDLLLLAMRIPVSLKVRNGYEKWILREAFREELPDYILARHKNPMSHSSGLHERVRLYKPLMSRWYRSFGYGVAGPMRRDFSIELLRAGNDLATALEAAKLEQDYSLSEQVRDFAGALRWNVRNAITPGRSSRAGR